MKAFEQVQIESDREFVERILKELDELVELRENFAHALNELREKIKQSLRSVPPVSVSDRKVLEAQIQTLRENFARKIRGWQGHAWSEFVERYSGLVYDQACRWTWRETQYQHEEKRSVFLFGKKRKFSDAAQNAYLWLLQQLQKKLRYYERMNEMPLADFIKMNLRSKNLLIDYLRWRGGFIPKVIAKCTREEKQVFYGLRQNLSVEEIAATMGLSTGRAEAVKKVLEIRDEIAAKLKQSGQMHTLNNESSIAIAVENEEFILAPQDWSTDDDISLLEMKECFISALRELTPQELSLLQLFYLEKFTTNELLKVYQLSGMNLPHVKKAPQEVTLDEVYKALEKTRAKLLRFFQEECEDLPGATINSGIVLELLKLLGVILK